MRDQYFTQHDDFAAYGTGYIIRFFTPLLTNEEIHRENGSAGTEKAAANVENGGVLKAEAFDHPPLFRCEGRGQVTHNPNVGVGRAWSGENCRADDDGNKYGPDDDRSVPAHGRGKLEAAGKFLLDGPASSQLAISPALAVSGDRFRPRGSAENQVSGADSDRADGGHQDEGAEYLSLLRRAYGHRR